MAGRELKQIFSAFSAGDDAAFRRAALTIIEEEEAKQHFALARDLRRRISHGDGGGTANDLSPLPAAPRDPDHDVPLADVFWPQRAFADLVLAPRSLEPLMAVAAETKHRQRLMEQGVPPRRKLMFWGPPGCGKSSAAEALANELGWPLMSVRIDSVVSSFLGETAANLRRVLEEARASQWVVVFDEFDALGRQRDDPTEHGEIKRVVSSFLQMLERFDGPSILIAATNHEKLLDDALWRRFDDVIEFRRPTVAQIKLLLRRRLASLPCRHPRVEEAASRLRGLPHAAAEYAVWDAYRAQIVAGESRVTAGALAAAIDRARQRPW